jgi:pimeloyl-ACP methyl ester carboxylesterase
MLPSLADVRVHDGFQDTFLRTSGIVLSSVRNALAANRVTTVLVTGHSLGGAVASMDAMMLRQNLHPSIIVNTVVFGVPRVGNKAWADLVDSTVRPSCALCADSGRGSYRLVSWSVQLGSSFIRVTNRADPIAIVPPRFLFFQQPAGEVHVTSVNFVGQVTGIVSCPGQDNAVSVCGSLMSYSLIIIFTQNCAASISLSETNISNHIGQ